MPSAPNTMAQSHEAQCPFLHLRAITYIPHGLCACVQAFQRCYAWREEHPALAAAGDMEMPMVCFETAIKASVAQGAAVPQADCTA